MRVEWEQLSPFNYTISRFQVFINGANDSGFKNEFENCKRFYFTI